MNQVLSLPLILKRRLFPAIAVFAAALGSAALYLSTVEPLYVASARLIVDERRGSISELGQELTASRTDPPGGANPLATESEFLRSQKVAERAVELLSVSNLEGDEPSAGAIVSRLSVKIIPATNILEVSYKTSKPEQAAVILNAVMQAVVAESAEAIRLEASAVSEFLQAEVPQLQSRLAQAEAAETEYRQQSGLVSPDRQIEQLVQRLSALEQEENRIVAQLEGATTRDDMLQDITDTSSLSEAYTAVRAGQNAELRELREKLVTLETEVIETQSRLGDQHPDLLALLEERDATQALYTEQLSLQAAGAAGVPPAGIAAEDLSQDLLSRLILGEVERSELESRLTVVQTERARIEARLAEIPLRQKPLATLVREKEEAAASLALLQSKLEEARIAEAQLISNIRIIDGASTPGEPVWPKPQAVFVLAIATGLVLAGGVIVLLELLDDAIHSADDVGAITQLPALGVLPRLPEDTLDLQQPDRFLDDPTLVEPYRMLLQTLSFHADEHCRIIVVSSASINEGKSTVASHLASVSALLSRRTLILDLDLRRPTQATLFHQPTVPGITTILAGKRTLEDAVQPTALENLWLLPHGDLSARPSVIVEQIAREGLLTDLAKSFDCIVIDTPPVSTCADAMILGRQSDGMFLVVRPGITSRSALQRAIAELRNGGVPLLGTVVNGGKTPTELYYHTATPKATLEPPSPLSPLLGTGSHHVSEEPKGTA